MKIEEIVSEPNELSDDNKIGQLKKILDQEGALVLKKFITPKAIQMISEEGRSKIDEAYFCASNHNVYLSPPDNSFPADHSRNLQVTSSKGLIGDDQISKTSPLKTLYENEHFKSFIGNILGQKTLFPYADPLSSVNLHFAKEGQELGWHFDNSSFAITLLIEKPIGGGEFLYVKDVRDADAGEMNFDQVSHILENKVQPEKLEMDAGTLVLFRGRNSIHSVTPTIGDKTRMLAVLAYNSEPGIELSESARQTFYGRLN